MRLAAALIVLVAAAPAPAQGPRLDMVAFFTGRTHAENQLKIVFKPASRLVVDSVGHKEGNNFILVDTVREQGKPVRQRKWVMHAAGPNRYSGTLTDAIGPVDIAVNGDTATIRYVMKDGHLNVVEQMELQPDGRTLANSVEARKFGLKFATVQGTIRKLD